MKCAACGYEAAGDTLPDGTVLDQHGESKLFNVIDLGQRLQLPGHPQFSGCEAKRYVPTVRLYRCPRCWTVRAE